jgi:hypothetical protein
VISCQHSKAFVEGYEDSCDLLDTYKCGKCDGYFCDNHLIYKFRSKPLNNFLCKTCCDLVDIERPSWENAT